MRDIAKHPLTSLTAVEFRYLDCAISQTNNHILYTTYYMSSAPVDPSSSVKNNYLNLETKFQLKATTFGRRLWAGILSRLAMFNILSGYTDVLCCITIWLG